MKKFFNKNIISFIIMFTSLFSFAFYIDIYTRRLINLSTFGLDIFKYRILWVFFSLSWISLIMLIIYLTKERKRIFVFNVINFIIGAIFVAQICYVQQLGKFMMVSDLFLAGEGLQYFKSVFFNLNLGMIITALFAIGCMILLYLINKNREYKNIKRNKYIIFTYIIIALVFRSLGYFSLGTEETLASWKENYNPKNIYINYTNPNTSMYVSGFYEYHVRMIYKYFYNLITLDKISLRAPIDEYNSIYGKKYVENDYTGIFKGKNVVYILMESIDTWVIDEETMPTLYKLQNSGINFTNRYSPFFNGGQTINSEFACNTGLYAISNRDTIYDIDDVDYDYSLANMLKNNNYKVNSFHANTGSFYNRNTFHNLLGYDMHYSASDLQDLNILETNKNYFLDSIMLNDDTLYDYMISDEPFLAFITTYSAHLDYDTSNKLFNEVGKILNEYDMPTEEYVYRNLAHDTDTGIKYLLNKFKEKGILDDTVFVFVSDHYVYGYSDPEYVALKKNTNNDRYNLQNTPFIIWSSDIEHENVNTILDTADILPTLLNMLGIKYNPNYYLGDDVFSESHDDFVWFDDGQFIKSNNSSLSDEAILTKANRNIIKNKNILITNYYGK